MDIFSGYKYVLRGRYSDIYIEDYNEGFVASNDGLWKCVNREKGKQ